MAQHPYHSHAEISILVCRTLRVVQPSSFPEGVRTHHPSATKRRTAKVFLALRQIFHIYSLFFADFFEFFAWLDLKWIVQPRAWGELLYVLFVFCFVSSGCQIHLTAHCFCSVKRWVMVMGMGNKEDILLRMLSQRRCKVSVSPFPECTAKHSNFSIFCLVQTTITPRNIFTIRKVHACSAAQCGNTWLGVV